MYIAIPLGSISFTLPRASYPSFQRGLYYNCMSSFPTVLYLRTLYTSFPPYSLFSIISNASLFLFSFVNNFFAFFPSLFSPSKIFLVADNSSLPQICFLLPFLSLPNLKLLYCILSLQTIDFPFTPRSTLLFFPPFSFSSFLPTFLPSLQFLIFPPSLPSLAFTLAKSLHITPRYLCLPSRLSEAGSSLKTPPGGKN